MKPNKVEFPEKLTVDELIEKMKHYASQSDLETIRLAYDFAEKAHAGQLRKSGEPYITHPLATAFILACMRIDPTIIIASLLHDVPEDTSVTLEEVEKNFGSDIASMVKGVTKLGKLKYRGMERYIENLRKMFVSMAEDIRVMIIKFADRTHNLKTLESLPEKKRLRIALESMEIYAPIANRLGMGEFKGMLEDFSFRYIQPKDYSRVKGVRDNMINDESDYLENIIKKLRTEMHQGNIKIRDVHGRKKQIYSLYQKLLEKNWQNDKIYDIVALRIIVEDIGDCYAALGIIHQLWRPLKGRIKDYISQPKPNGYQSIHTTVFCDEGKVVEFQIRTQTMHEEAEYGAAAHWHYDEQGHRLPTRDFNWAKELAGMQQEILKNSSDLEEMKFDFFQSRIFVFTPQGDVIDLPEKATPVDFAYHIHTEVGNKCNGAKVNDQLVSLDTTLKSGDVVDIIVDKNRKGPSPDWIKFAKTHIAKSHIKAQASKNSLNWIKNILPIKK